LNGESLNKMEIYVKQEDNVGGNEFKVKARTIIAGVKVYKWLGNVKVDWKSKITVLKRFYVDNNDYIEKELISGVDSELIVKDSDFVEHEYILRIDEANCEIVGVVYYA